MPFSDDVCHLVLTKSHRRCCVCHEFAGLAANVHHIVQEADGGTNTSENAICLCYGCHAQAGHYNPRHPLGKKYSPAELRLQRDQWWEICARPAANHDSIWTKSAAYGVGGVSGAIGNFDIPTEIRKAQTFLAKITPIVDGIYNDLRSGAPRSIGKDTFEGIEKYRYWREQALGVNHPERFFNLQYDLRRNSLCAAMADLAKLLIPLNYVLYADSYGRVIYSYQNAKFSLDEDDKLIMAEISVKMKNIIDIYSEFQLTAR